MFQHTAARRRLVSLSLSFIIIEWFQHTAARRRLAKHLVFAHGLFLVSTHSRPKAAGHKFQLCMSPMTRFNTQPPEGGWCRSRR